MAFRRGLSIRATLLSRRTNPSFSYISHHDDDQTNHQHSSRSMIDTYLTQRRSFGSCINNTSCQFTGAFRRTGYGCVGNGLILNRYMSTSFGEADTTSFPSEVPTLITDDVAAVISNAPVEAVASQTLAASEVAIAAADSVFPVAALQHLIDGVHSVTGLNWWASIVLTTLLVRVATIPFLISVKKETLRFALMGPKLLEIKAQVRATGMEPRAVAEGKQKVKELCKQYGVSIFTPYKHLLVGIPIFVTSILAILNMVEKVPSFKTGGALWFTDLTTPDAMYIFPVLTTLMVLVPRELQWGDSFLKMNPQKTNFARVFTALLALASLSFPQAIFCYWDTTIIFSLCYRSVIGDPRVQKALGILKIPAVPRSATSANSSDTSRDK